MYNNKLQAKHFAGWLLATVLTAAVICQQQLTAAELSDPTRPPSVTSEPQVTRTGGAKTLPGARLRLLSTLVAPDRRLAVINDQVVQKGDKIGNAEILDIQATSVKLRRGTLEYQLELLSKKVKKPAQPPGRDEP